jgi:hypothetical protein
MGWSGEVNWLDMKKVDTKGKEEERVLRVSV